MYIVLGLLAFIWWIGSLWFEGGGEQEWMIRSHQKERHGGQGCPLNCKWLDLFDNEDDYDYDYDDGNDWS